MFRRPKQVRSGPRHARRRSPDAVICGARSSSSRSDDGRLTRRAGRDVAPAEPRTGGDLTVVGSVAHAEGRTEGRRVLPGLDRVVRSRAPVGRSGRAAAARAARFTRDGVGVAGRGGRGAGRVPPPARDFPKSEGVRHAVLGVPANRAEISPFSKKLPIRPSLDEICPRRGRGVASASSQGRTRAGTTRSGGRSAAGRSACRTPRPARTWRNTSTTA